MDQINHKHVQWNSDKEAFELVSDPNWDIETEINIYNALMNKGYGDHLSSTLLAQFNQTRPLYPCYCHTAHKELAYKFQPCFCAECEQVSLLNKIDHFKPLAHTNLSKNSIHVIGSFIKQALPELNSILAQEDVEITPQDLQVFQSLLFEYGSTDKTWTEVIDSSSAKEEHYPDFLQYHSIMTLLEFYWLLYSTAVDEQIFNNPST